MKLLLAKLCEYAGQQQNGRHTMVGIFDNIVAASIPIDHPPFHICLQFEFGPDEGDRPLKVRVTLLDPDARSLLDIGAEGIVPRESNGGPVRLFMQFHIPGLRFEKVGDHRLDVEYNGEQAGEERIPVLVVSGSG